MADYTTLKAAIASVIKTNGNQEITGLLLQQTLHSMLDGVNTTKQDTINFVINTANKFLRDDGTFQEIQSPAGGFANNLYFTDIDSVVVSGYKTLSYNPDAGTINLNASVTSAEGVKTVQNYLYPSGVSVDLFPSGLWSFNFYAYLDLNVGNTQIGVQYFKRSVAGVETNLFTAWSAEINNTTPLWIKFEATNPSFIVDPTDRMGARILVKTTSTPAVNLTIAIGDGYAAYLNNPNRIRHSQLRDWNGDPNYLHITQTEKTNFQTAYTDRFKWDGGSSGLNAVTGRESLGLRIGIDVLAYRTFGSAANNNTGDFLAYNGVAVDSSKLGGQLPSYYQTNITAGTSLQYYRGDKTMQTLDTSVVPENSNMYFTYPRVLATALTGYAAGANTALSATDTILAAMGKIQGQINARALASDLSGHINNTTIHLTADEKTYLGKIMTYLKVAVDNTSMYSTINFYSESGVSAYGIGTGGGGGAGVDIIDNLLSVRADAALSANQGRILKGFVDLKQSQLNGLGFVKANGTSILYDNTSYATSASLLSHTGSTSNPHSVTAAQVGALALTGGTITGGYNALKIKRDSANPALISYENTVGVLGFIGVNTSSQPIFVTPDLVTTYNFWHSGNLLNIGTTASTARTALGLGSMATETASNYSQTSHNHSGVYHPLMSTIFSLQGSYVGVRTANRTASQYYEFWDSGAGWAKIYSGGFVNANSSDSYILLGGGGTKAISDFSLTSHNHNGTYALIAGSLSQSFSVNRLTTNEDIYINGSNLYFENNTNKTIRMRTASAWWYDLKTINNDFSITDADNYEFIKLFYNSGNKYTKIGNISIQGGALSGATTGSFSGNVSAASFTSGGNAVLHAGNYSSYALPLSGGILDTPNGEIIISPTGWREPTRASIKIRSKSDVPAEIDLRHTVGGIESGWHLSARDSGGGSPLIYYRYNMDSAGVADSSSFTQMYVFNPNGVFDASGVRVNGNAVIHSGNIGSQSVNYANSAGQANKLRFLYPYGSTDVNTYLSGGGSLWHYGQGASFLNAPSWFQYGSIYQFNSYEDSLSLQIATTTIHDTTTPTYKIGWRMSNNLGWQNDWKEIIHSGNIGSQSVNYAASAGNADRLDGKDWLEFLWVKRSVSDIDVADTYIYARDDGGWIGGTQTLSGFHNGYGVISMHLHSGDYYGQIHLSANTQDMGIRFKNGTADWGVTHKVWHSGNLTNTLSNGYLPYWNGSSLGDTILWFGSSNVYIGSKRADDAIGLISQNYSMGYTYSTKFITLQSATEQYGITNDYGVGTGAQLSIVANQTFGNIGFYTGGAKGDKNERMRILSNGNVGIGYTDRSEKFAVNGSGYFNGNLSASGYLSLFSGSAGGTTFMHTKQANHQYLHIEGNGNYESMVRYTNTNGSWYVGMRVSGTLTDYQFYSVYTGTTVASISNVGSISVGNTSYTPRHYFYANQSSYGVIHLVSATSETSIGYRKPSGSGGWTVGRGIGGSEYFGWWNDDANATRMYLSTTGALWTASYIESASYLKGTSIKIGANWEAIPNGNDLELRYGGVMKAKLSSSGDILAVGGVTAFAV